MGKALVETMVETERKEGKERKKGLNRVEKNRKGMTKGREKKGEAERVKRV